MAEPSARLLICMSGVAAIGQSLRQRDGRLSAEREISRRRMGGAMVLEEGLGGARTFSFSPAGVSAGEKVGPQKNSRAPPSAMMTPGVVAQDSGCSITGVRSMDLERLRWTSLFRPSLCRMCEWEVM